MKYAEQDTAAGNLDRKLMEGGTDLEHVLGAAASSVGFYMVKRKMRKLGAPPWVAYGVAMIDWTLTAIALNLQTRNRYLIAKQARLRNYDKAFVKEQEARADWAVDRSGTAEPAD